MNTDRLDFEETADQVLQLRKFQELFESCGKLMADTLVNEGKIFSIGGGLVAQTAQQFSGVLASSADNLRPPLPAIFLREDADSLQQLQALGKEGDFSIFFNGPVFHDLEGDSSLDNWLDACLDLGIASILINPDIDQVESTDKALEIRLEYRSITDYLTTLSAVSNFLTKSIEMQLFGGQA